MITIYFLLSEFVDLVGLQSFDVGQEVFGFGKYKEIVLLAGEVPDLAIQT